MRKTILASGLCVANKGRTYGCKRSGPCLQNFLANRGRPHMDFARKGSTSHIAGVEAAPERSRPPTAGFRQCRRRIPQRQFWRAAMSQSSQTNFDTVPTGSVRAKSPAKREAAVVSKSDLVLKKLRGAKGASLQQLADVTGWQLHSVRGFLSAIVRKKLGLNLVSDVGKDDVRRYRIADHSRSVSP